MSTTTGADDAPKQCDWCGCYHRTICPRVKSLSFHQNGSVDKIEFWPENEKTKGYVEEFNELRNMAIHGSKQ
jgi:hypothetical protein